MVLIDQERCSGCGLCVEDCIDHNIKIVDGKAKVQYKCLQCGHCVAICPQRAVSIPEYDMDDLDSYEVNLDTDALLNSIKARRSIRKYKPQKVEKEKLDKMFDAARYTATSKNSQGNRYVLVQDELDTLKAMLWKEIERVADGGKAPDVVFPSMVDRFPYFLRLKDRGTDFLFRNAPAVLFIAANKPMDASLAAQNMELMAISQGLGVLYDGYLNNAINLAPEIKQWLGIEGRQTFICMLLGYPDVKYVTNAPRKSADVVWK